MGEKTGVGSRWTRLGGDGRGAEVEGGTGADNGGGEDRRRSEQDNEDELEGAASESEEMMDGDWGRFDGA